MSPTSAGTDVPVDPPLSLFLSIRTKLRLLEFADKVLSFPSNYPTLPMFFLKVGSRNCKVESQLESPLPCMNVLLSRRTKLRLLDFADKVPSSSSSSSLSLQVLEGP